jgi:hypothetical protein
MKTPTQIITTNSDFDGDGTIDGRSLTTNTYDRKGNILTNVYESDDNADGTIDNRFSTTNTYDQKGNLRTSVSKDDFDGDGTVDSRQETLYEYLNGSQYVIGVSTREIEVLADDSFDVQINPLSEQLNLPFTVSEI